MKNTFVIEVNISRNINKYFIYSCLQFCTYICSIVHERLIEFHLILKIYLKE